MNGTPWKGSAALLLAAFLYGTSGLLIREMSAMFSDTAQAAGRFVVAIAVLGLLALCRARVPKLNRERLGTILTLGLLFSMSGLLFTIAVNTTTLTNSVVLLYAGGIVSSFAIGTFRMGERVTVGKVCAVAVAMCGLATYAPGFAGFGIGLFAATTAGVISGVCNGLRKALAGTDRNDALFFQYGCAALVATAVAVFSPGPAIREFAPIPLGALVVFGVCLVTLGNLLLYGFQHFDVNAGTIILATEIFFATFVGFLAYHEIPRPHEFAGGALVFLASVLTVVKLPLLTRHISLRGSAVTSHG